jgi:hypothetical protein
MPFAEDQDMIQAVAPSVPIRLSTYGFCHGDLGDISDGPESPSPGLDL